MVGFVGPVAQGTKVILYAELGSWGFGLLFTLRTKAVSLWFLKYAGVISKMFWHMELNQCQHHIDRENHSRATVVWMGRGLLNTWTVTH